MLPSAEISVDHRGVGEDGAVTSHVIVSTQILDWQTCTRSPRTQPLNKRPTPRFTRHSRFTFLGLGILHTAFLCLSGWSVAKGTPADS